MSREEAVPAAGTAFFFYRDAENEDQAFWLKGAR